MSTNIPFNGQVYPVPTQGDPAPWGPALDRYLIALGAGAISPSGGSYPLTADLNLGDNFGVIAKYFTSGSATPATAGTLRLAKGDTIDWRNNANSGNNVLAVDGSDNLTYNGTALQPTLGALPDGEIWIGNGSSVATPQTLSGAITTTDTGVTSISAGYITNTMVNASAAIAYSKLNLSGSIINTDIFSGAAIAYSKLNLSNSILNADINSSAGIAYSKLNLTGGIVNTDVNASAAIDFSKLAGLTSAHILVGNGSAVATDVALSGDAALANTGALTLATVNSDVGSFTLASITVNAKGLVTAASSGSAVVTSVSGTANQITSTGGTTPVLAIANPVTFPGAMTAGGALAMGSNKITGLANGSVSTDAAAFGQVPISTDWASYIPTWTGCGTVSSNTAYWRQIGNHIFVKGFVTFGTVTSNAISITLPNSTIINTSHTVANQIFGQGIQLTNSGSATFIAITDIFMIFTDGSTNSTVFVGQRTQSNGIVKDQGGSILGSSKSLSYWFDYPI